MHRGDLVGAIHHAPLLGAVLDETAVFARRLNAAASLDECMAEGFLDVDIFARLAGPNGQERMPVVGRSNRDYIEVLVGEGLTNILETLGRIAAFFTDSLAP